MVRLLRLFPERRAVQWFRFSVPLIRSFGRVNQSLARVFRVIYILNHYWTHLAITIMACIDLRLSVDAVAVKEIRFCSPSIDAVVAKTTNHQSAIIFCDCFICSIEICKAVVHGTLQDLIISVNIVILACLN